MKISDLYSNSEPIYSLEVFPVKKGESIDVIFDALDGLMEFNPAFVSVTEGVNGDRKKTVKIANQLNVRYPIETVVHMVLRGRTKEQIDSQVREMKRLGLYHLLALRGDKPKPGDCYKYASDLVSHLRNGGGAGDFSIGVAAYPNTHPESKTRDDDIYFLKVKVDSGADFIVDQMIFDSNSYFSHLGCARAAGIDVLILPGVMAITNYAQFKFVTKNLNIDMPNHLRESIEKNKDNPKEIKQIFEEHTIKMCKELLAGGAPGIHFYTMNKAKPTANILRALKA